VTLKPGSTPRRLSSTVGSPPAAGAIRSLTRPAPSARSTTRRCEESHPPPKSRTFWGDGQLVILSMEQHTLENVNNCLNTNIYSYLETSGGQSFILYLKVVNFFNTSAN